LKSNGSASLDEIAFLSTTAKNSYTASALHLVRHLLAYYFEEARK